MFFVFLYAYGDWSDVRLRCDDDPWSTWRSFESTLSWSLPTTPGMHTVEVQMRNGDSLITSSDTIEYVGEPNGQHHPFPQADAMVFLPLVTR